MTDPSYEITEEEAEKIACAIRHYLLPEYLPIVDVYAVIENRQLVDDDPLIWAYHCPCQTVYLDDAAYAVNCGRQYVSRVYFNEYDEIIMDQQTMNIAQDLAPEEYDHMTAKVYYDFREEIPIIPFGFDGDTSLVNVLTLLGSYEWKREESGGGGVRG
jgi:hypothetical protein